LIVGVTGHRPSGLRDADTQVLRAAVRSSLERLAAADPGVPRRLVSPLAEGSDRLVADEASALGWELVGFLPFAREEYEKDFHTAESLREFDRLLGKARQVQELAGRRDTKAHRDSAYTAVGRLVLEVSDVLVAIWDGQGARGEGGTAQIVGEAAQRGLPTVWIPSEPPHEPLLLPPTGPARLPPRVMAALASRFAKPKAPG
jgi:hypothetical protein